MSRTKCVSCILLLPCILSNPCTFSVPAGSSQCYNYDLGTLAAGPFTLQSAYPDTYFASAPCASLAAATVSHDCPDSAGALLRSGTKVVQQRSAGACLSCAGGKATTAQFKPLNGQPNQGIEITFGGGDGGRTTVFSMVCNVSVAEPSAPQHLVSEQPSETYHISWQTSLACPTLAACTRAPTPAPSPLPLPSAAQLEYHADEKGAILHFNMGTFQSCGIGVGAYGKPFVPPASTFNPAAGKIDTDRWVASLKAYGARRAVLVVSHGCGFSTFPARTQFPQSSAFPNGFAYNYSIAHSSYLGGSGDLAKDFVASCKKYSIKPGFYYGAMNNAYLNVVSGTVQQGSACDFCPDISQHQVSTH